MITIILSLWILCGVLAYGISFAYWQRKCPASEWREDSAFSFLYACFGPIGLSVAFVASGYAQYGLLYRPSKR